MLIIDRRYSHHDRSTENRQRFLKRIKKTLKTRIDEIIQERSLGELGASSEEIQVDPSDISEPVFHYGAGGTTHHVDVGNDRFVEGDRIPKRLREELLGGAGKGAGGNGKKIDRLIIRLSREEFLKLLFEDLELPHLERTALLKMKEWKWENAGVQLEGTPNRLNLFKSYKQSFMRRKVKAAGYDRMIEGLLELKREIAAGKVYETQPEILREVGQYLDLLPETLVQPSSDALLDRLIGLLEDRKKNIKFFEEDDLRYRLRVRKEIPQTHATMIMIKDVSGSMGVNEQRIARLFFWLCLMFLKDEYETVDIIPIAHTTEAYIMSEDEFFNTTDSGGTVVSSALEVALEQIKEIAGKTNIYVTQVSDGDNSSDDYDETVRLAKEIMPYVRYFAYVQVDDYHDRDDTPSSIAGLANYDSGIWRAYSEVGIDHKWMNRQRVYQESDIYKVFRELFKKGVID